MAKTLSKTRSRKKPRKRPIKRRRTAKQERAEALKKSRSFLTMHRARCPICKHKDFNEITKAYLRGTSSVDICQAYGIKDPRSLYAHARALQLRTLREARSARSSLLRARHILSLCRFSEDNPPNKDIVKLALTMEHEAYMATLPKKLQLSGSIQIKDRLIPLAEEMARNVLARIGVSKETIDRFLPQATVDSVVAQGLGQTVSDSLPSPSEFGGGDDY